MLKNQIVSLLLLLIALMFCHVSFGDARYFLCGPDEDGCPENQMQYCACIPLDEINFPKPYCLDFDNMRCEPLSKVPDCNLALIFKDQGRCLATIFQSEPEPPCLTTSLTFCRENHAWICDVSGDPSSCKPS
jgi:hypothetical protein